MSDEERKELGAIVQVLATLRGRWIDPRQRLEDHATALEVSAASDQRRHDNPALITELQALEEERARIQSLLHGGQAAGAGQIAALAERVERLRIDFSTLTS